MAATLSKSLRDGGQELLNLTDSINFGAQGAAWILDAEEDLWKFFLVTALYDDRGPTWIYHRLLRAFRARPLPDSMDKAEIHLASPSHGLFQLMSHVASISGGGGGELSGIVVNDILLPDAYVYRLLATPSVEQSSESARRFDQTVDELAA